LGAGREGGGAGYEQNLKAPASEGGRYKCELDLQVDAGQDRTRKGGDGERCDDRGVRS